MQSKSGRNFTQVEVFLSTHPRCTLENISRLLKSLFYGLPLFHPAIIVEEAISLDRFLDSKNYRQVLVFNLSFNSDNCLYLLCGVTNLDCTSSGLSVDLCVRHYQAYWLTMRDHKL